MDADLAEHGRAIIATAAEVAGELAGLRHALAPTRELWTGVGPDLDPADEWTIAVDGLLGADGVLGQISRALDTPWPALPSAGWSGAEPASPGA
ncbi:hypothetical protein [Actinoplanes sp. NBRC 103695]|uniref:hypothetical protein n=1 Tax=Actinoplanes sp. NBRC 103695 TaxID=3032202 RepID=UPI0024A3ED61|nr:hypothetical protein [Actinoplanes sp. NBRC 103695]GLZ01991.1 hypothetical protein Acsp02_92420 [Actinoplanes sp. NBRC 103695]